MKSTIKTVLACQNYYAMKNEVQKLEKELRLLFEELEGKIWAIHTGEYSDTCEHLVSKAKEEILGET